MHKMSKWEYRKKSNCFGIKNQLFIILIQIKLKLTSSILKLQFPLQRISPKFTFIFKHQTFMTNKIINNFCRNISIQCKRSKEAVTQPMIHKFNYNIMQMNGVIFKFFWHIFISLCKLLFNRVKDWTFNTQRTAYLRHFINRRDKKNEKIRRSNANTCNLLTGNDVEVKKMYLHRLSLSFMLISREAQRKF